MTITRTPWPTDTTVITDAGLETWLLFQRGIDLPGFAAYPLLADDDGRALLLDYYEQFMTIAADCGAAVDLETPTWRANPEWAATLGHSVEELQAYLDASIDLVASLRSTWRGSQPMLIGGVVGPRGDGYVIGKAQSAQEAQEYHSFQIEYMAPRVDLLTAMTIGYTEEAIGIARAAEAAGVPVVISFTVETDGTLPSGVTLGEAIATTDAATGSYPLHYMINCAHPTHFEHALGGEWAARVGGLRANASTLSHAELDVMEELDAGDPHDLAARYSGLRASLPALHQIGGCCGTDHSHVAAIAGAWSAR